MNLPSLAKTLLVTTFTLWGTQRLLRAARRRAQAMRDRTQQPIETWESEGGAVPVSRHRTAAEVAPAEHDRA